MELAEPFTTSPRGCHGITSLLFYITADALQIMTCPYTPTKHLSDCPCCVHGIFLSSDFGLSFHVSEAQTTSSFVVQAQSCILSLSLLDSQAPVSWTVQRFSSIFCIQA